MTPKHWLAQAVVVVMLLIALFGGLGGSFFDVLRLVVAVAFVWIGYLMFKKKEVGWTIACGVIVLLFNPLVPFYLGRPLWVIVDLITGGIAIYSVYLLTRDTSRNKELSK